LQIKNNTPVFKLFAKIKAGLQGKGMTKIDITDSNELILPEGNFRYREFYRTRFGCYGTFKMYYCFVKCLQVFRDHYSAKYKTQCPPGGVPIEVTSVYRPYDQDWSPHKTGDAVDSIALVLFAEIMQDFEEELKNWRQSQLIKDMLATGANVFIIENGCLHISYRTYNLNYHEDFAPKAFYLGRWDNPDVKMYPHGINTCYNY
jgi:hypothetical protein